jgi:hypothetical protein
MGQKVTITLVDDLDGTLLNTGEGETIQFSFDGSAYEIDLTLENAGKFREAVAPYVKAARASGKAAHNAGSTKGRTASSSTSKEELSAAREWLRSEGHEVSNRGRISADKMELFRNAKK